MLPRALKSHFVAAIRRMLRPVVRQLIANGLSYPAFSKLVKQLYVEIAEDEFGLPFKRLTDSRLSLVTGINRKEISQLRRRKATRQPLLEVEDTLVTHVLGRWMAGPPYTTTDGTPLPLPYETRNLRAVTFARLVRDLGTDIPVRSVLDELLQVKAVELRADGHVVLRREAHIPAADLEGKLTLLGSDPAELFTTIMHNIEHGDAPRLQRKVVYDNIGSDALADLRAQAGTLGEEFIRRANTLLASHDRDRTPGAPGGKRSRVVLGAYYFEEDAGEENAPEEPSPPPGRIRRL